MASRLAHLLSPGSGELLYRYDFGDEWTHEITVVGDRPRGNTPLPHCVAASGRAPAEDSGGPDGWAELLAAAADPGHPRHAESRLWLGLPDGASVDPAVADTGTLGRRLAGLE